MSYTIKIPVFQISAGRNTWVVNPGGLNEKGYMVRKWNGAGTTEKSHEGSMTVMDVANMLRTVMEEPHKLIVRYIDQDGNRIDKDGNKIKDSEYWPEYRPLGYDREELGC